MITVAEMMKAHEENGGKFPAGMGTVVQPTDEETLHAAKTELRRVAMVLHNEARAVLQNVFLCPADVKDALDHLCVARHAARIVIESPIIINALNIPK